jgi:predicted MFS family arabinose efflux permease
MKQQEIATRKAKTFILLGVGVAALIGSYAVGYVGPRNSVSVMSAILLTAIFLGCIFIAGRMVLKLNKETASK